MGSRVVVVLPTETYRATDFVEAARRLGIELTIASESELPLLASDRQVLVDCSDPAASAERVADVAATTPIDAIVAADDAGVEIAARASELIGLPASPVAAVRATLDKSLMRSMLERAEVAQPAFEVVDGQTVVQDAHQPERRRVDGTVVDASGKPARAAGPGSISTAHGRSVGVPNSSWLK